MFVELVVLGEDLVIICVWKLICRLRIFFGFILNGFFIIFVDVFFKDGDLVKIGKFFVILNRFFVVVVGFGGFLRIIGFW